MNSYSVNPNEIPVSLPANFASPSSEADNAGLLLIACACNMYREKFKSQEVPFSFIEFYIEEMSHFANKMNSAIKEFFNYHKNTKKLDMFIRMYTFSKYNISKDIKTIDGYQYLVLDPKNKFYIKDSIKKTSSETDRETAAKLIETYNLYKNNDELKNINELYDDYLIKNFIENYNNVEHQNKSATKQPVKQTDTKNSEKQQIKDLDTTYIGTKHKAPNQKGKVVQLNIPRYELPMSYPIDLNNSRLLSERRVNKILYADKCIKLLNNHKITAIGFSLGFVEKRKSAKKKRNIGKFDFDF